MLKRAILLFLNFLTNLFILLCFMYKIKHTIIFINVLFFLVLIFLIVFNFVTKLKWNLFLDYLRLITLICLIILAINIGVSLTLLPVSGLPTTINVYCYEENNNKCLKNIYYSDTISVQPPIELVYEETLLLGFQCHTVIDSNTDTISLFNLEKVYQEIRDNKIFCNNNLNYYKKQKFIDS